MWSTASGAERARRPALRRASAAGAVHTGVGPHSPSAATFGADRSWRYASKCATRATPMHRDLTPRTAPDCCPQTRRLRIDERCIRRCITHRELRLQLLSSPIPTARVGRAMRSRSLQYTRDQDRQNGEPT